MLHYSVNWIALPAAVISLEHLRRLNEEAAPVDGSNVYFCPRNMLLVPLKILTRFRELVGISKYKSDRSHFVSIRLRNSRFDYDLHVALNMGRKFNVDLGRIEAGVVKFHCNAVRFSSIKGRL